MVRVGIVGIGFMGMIHYLAYRRVRGARVVALCETDKTRLAGDWRTIQGNFGPRGTKMDLAGIARYRDAADLFADESIDLVDICLPTSLHPKLTMAGLASGKHVFCEKPIALSTADAKRMVDAAKKARRQLYIGHVLPFFPEFQFVYEAARSRKYGRLLGGQFKRVISDPLWMQGYYDPKRLGGPMLDLHVHDAHFIRLLFGMPVSVNTVGRMRGEVAEFFTTQFRFKDSKLAVTATSGVIDQQGRPFNHGYEVQFEKATVAFELAVMGGEGNALLPLSVFDDQGKVRHPKMKAGDDIAGFVAELKHATSCVAAGKSSDILAAGLARDAVVLCHKQTKSLASGRSVKI